MLIILINLIQIFNSKYRYLEHVGNPYFNSMVNQIKTPEFHFNRYK